MYVVPKWKSLEIDELPDLIMAEAIMNNLEQLEKYIIFFVHRKFFRQISQSTP